MSGVIAPVVNFTQESYTVGEANDTLTVCVQVSFLDSLLLDPEITLVLRTLQDSNSGEQIIITKLLSIMAPIFYRRP